jgi:hypothetical protein
MLVSGLSLFSLADASVSTSFSVLGACVNVSSLVAAETWRTN